MGKRTDIKKILVIGSGPIVIGQAAEFDYSGTQACTALKEEGYNVILANSNPATIMTDTHMANKVYMEPLTLEYIAKIIRMERPDALIPNLGGQTALNLAMQLHKKGVLEECSVEILGTRFDSIDRAEDRELFKNLCIAIGEPVLESYTANTVEQCIQYAQQIGFPVILRPAFTLGGTGGGFADNMDELIETAKNALQISPVTQVLVEKSIKGYKEIEFEVMRDKNDTAIAICSMENIDPIGVHTGDSMVVAPAQTLTNKEVEMLRTSALKIIRELGIEGGCNVQFALDPHSFTYYLIEVNPRVSRSSALASKATGYPIARVSAKIACGYTLDEIDVGAQKASCEPAIDYIVAKVARFPFDKFANANRTLGTQMKATGEVMAIGRTFEQALLKSVRGLEVGACHPHLEKYDGADTQQMLNDIKNATDERLFVIAELLRRGVSAQDICRQTKIDLFFIDKIKNIVDFEKTIKANVGDEAVLREAKIIGIADKYIGQCWGKDETEIYKMRKAMGLTAVYKRIDTCAGLLPSDVQYYYASFSGRNESIVSGKKSVLVLGSGPIRIGQGVEFDYSTVHAIWAIREAGYEAIIINCNPETVSTDHTTSDKLYFEPLTVEDVMAVYDHEKPMGVMVSLGGQTAINLADKLEALGANILGTGVEAIARAENRDIFEKALKKLNIPQPNGKAVTNVRDGLAAAAEIGYPVLVRPSYVLGGRAMQIVAGDEQLRRYLTEAVQIDEKQPVLVDKYIIGKELEVDAICDGERVLIPGIMEHVERTGIHSGDSISVYPTFSVNDAVRATLVDYTTKLGLGLGIKGLYNIQFIVDKNNDVYIIEVNPRSSRTVPFISKATGIPLANIATKVALGSSLKAQGYEGGLAKSMKRWYVKVPVFSFNKLMGLDAFLSPEMKSTGEAIGYDVTLNRALYKALKASGARIENYGTVFVTIANEDKDAALELIRRFYNLGFNIEATSGTATMLKQNGIKTRVRKKISAGSNEILEMLRQGHVAYVINTLGTKSDTTTDGFLIRRSAIEHGVTMFTSLDTVRVLLDVLEELTLGIATIDEKHAEV